MKSEHEIKWSISDVKTTEGETMIVGGIGQEFGLIAVVTDEADAKQIIADREARTGAPQALSQWTDRDMLIGGTRYKAGSITIADVLDHAARASNEFYADDDELSEEDRHMVDWAWEKHKSAAPKFLATEDGEFNGNVVPERETVTIFVPDGYSSAAEFVKDCGFEPATTPPQSAVVTDEADAKQIIADREARTGAPAARTSRWRYEIQDGPEGEFKNAEFAQVFDGRGASVGTVKLHHAFMIVGSINNDEVVTIETPPIPPLLQREWMAQALFEVDAPDHLEWEDVGIDKRERYLCLADAAIRRNNTCP